MSETIQIKTLTPLWTGDIDGKCSRIKETGVIGSLRWWYEELMKASGEDICNPTADNSEERCDKENGDICQVCRLFGCTGQKKKFGLRISGDFTDSTFVKYHYPNRPNKESNWYLKPGKLSTNHSIFELWDIFENYDNIGLIISLFGFLSENAGIGAKTQFGYGIIEPTVIDYELELLKRRLGEIKENKKIFFLKLNFDISETAMSEIFDETRNWGVCKSNGYLPTSPYFRYLLRESLREKSDINKSQRHNLMGKLNSTNSNLKVSHIYKNKKDSWEMRVWGNVPPANSDIRVWIKTLKDITFWEDKTVTELKVKENPKFKWLEEVLE